MKQYILYILVFLLLSCKTNKKTTKKNLVNIAVVDSVKEITLQEHQKSLKKKLIGKIYKGNRKIQELKKYPNQGVFHIGSIEDSPRYTSITFKDKNLNVKVILFLRVDDESLNEAMILDLIEVEKYTKSYDKEKTDKLDVFSDVLLRNKRAPELLALAEYEEAEEMTNVYKVWRANRKTGKFEEVKDISGITVFNEDY